jgi:hypothetical protein
MEPAKTQEEKEARIKAAIEGRGIKPGTEDYNTWYDIYDKKIQVVPPAATVPSTAMPAQSPASTIAVAPPAIKPTATAEQWREEANKKVAETYGLKLSFVRGLSDQTILNDYPEAKSIRGSYAVVPNAEKNPSPVSSINAGAAASKEQSVAEQASVARYNKSQGFEEQGPFLGEPTETQLSAAGNPDILYPANDIIPVEYRASFEAMGPGWRDAFSPQTSLGYSPTIVTGIKPQPTPIMENDVDTDTALRQASQDALVQLREYLTQNNPEYKNGTEDQRALILYREMRGLVDPPTIKQGALGEDEATKEERDINATFFRAKEDSSAPDYTPAQMHYISSFRSSLANQFKNQGGMNRVNELIGSPQWYENEDMKRQVLASPPEFYGVLGLGNYVYPSGATRESTGMYAMRMAAAPANFVVGGVTSLLTELADLPGQGAGELWRKARERSEITPAGSFPNAEGAWERGVATALDNVKRNRGATEEIYDFGVGVPGVENQYAKGALFGVGLLTDILAVPIVPGASAAVELVSGTGAAAKAAARGATVATKGERAAAVLENLAPDPIAYVARKAGLTEAPGDIRLISAQGYMSKIDEILEYDKLVAKSSLTPLSIEELKRLRYLEDTYPNGISAIKKGLPPSLAADIDNARALVRAAMNGDAAALASRNLSRWIQAALGADEDLRTLISREANNLLNNKKAPGPSKVISTTLRAKLGPQDIIQATLDLSKGNPEILRKIERAAMADTITNSVIKADKEMGAGNLYILTPRVAVASPEKANEIIAAVKEHPIFELLQKPSLTREETTAIRTHLMQKLDFGSYSRTATEDILKTLVDAEHLSPKQVRGIIDILTNDIALSGKAKVAAVDIERLGDEGVKLNIFTPHEVRPTLLNKWIRERIEAISNSTVLSDPANAAITSMKQELAALPGIINQKINALAAASGGRAKATIILFRNELLKPHMEIVDSIISMARYNQMKSTALFEKGSNFLHDPVIKQVLDDIDARFRTNMDALRREGKGGDYNTIVKQIDIYLEELRTAMKNRDFPIGIVDKDRIPELIVSSLFDVEANVILRRKLSELYEVQHLDINKKIIADADIDMNLARTIVNDMVALKIRGEWKGVDSFLNDIDDLYKIVNLQGASFKNTAKRTAVFHLDEIADDVFRHNGFDKLSSAAEKEAALVVLKQELNRNRLHFIRAGSDNLLQGAKESSYDIKKLADYVRKNPDDYRIITAAKIVLQNLQKMQYFFMLSLRTRFHGMNILTAPFIAWSTIGAEKAWEAIGNFPGGMYLSAKIQEAISTGGNLGEGASRVMTGDISPAVSLIDIPGKIKDVSFRVDPDYGTRSSNYGKKAAAMDATVAFKTATGKPYTWGDLRDMAIRGGIFKTETGFAGGREALKPLADEIANRLGTILGTRIPGLETVEKKANFFYDGVSSIAPFFDGAWRTSVMIAALKAGRTEQDAIILAREALFDYGRMTEAEQKYIGSWFMYYSFFRASMANAIENLLQNPSRLANQLKIAKGLDPLWGTASESEDNSLFYRKEYLQSRARIGFKRGGNTNENYDIYAPPLPLVDSYVLLAKILGLAMGNKEFGFGDYLIERSSPLPKIALGISRKQLEEIYGRGYIDPRHIAWLRATGTWDMFLYITCGKKTRPIPIDVKEGDTAFLVENGIPKTWSFEGNQKAIDAYISLLLFVQASGAQLAINDYAFIMDDLGGLDLPQEGIELSWQPGEMSGAATYVKNSGTSIVRAANARAQDAAKMKIPK